MKGDNVGTEFLVQGNNAITGARVEPLTFRSDARCKVFILFLFNTVFVFTRFILNRCDGCKQCYHFHCLDPPIKVSQILIGHFRVALNLIMKVRLSTIYM